MGPLLGGPVLLWQATRLFLPVALRDAHLINIFCEVKVHIQLYEKTNLDVPRAGGVGQEIIAESAV